MALVMIRSFAQPSSGASAPTALSGDVLSLFGSHYTQSPLAAGNTNGRNVWWQDWGQGTQVSYLNVAGDTTISYSNLGYQGVQFQSAVNASSMDSVHLDVWTADCTTLNFFLINTTTGVQKGYAITPSLSNWTSVSIPLSYYSNVGVDNIGQVMFTGNGTIYLQNIYFFKTADKPTITGFTIPTQTLGATSYTIINPTSNSTGAFTYSSSNTAVATVSGNVITIEGLGTCTITATQDADNNYSVGTATATLTVTFPGPTTAATVPTANSTDVISLFGSHYTQNSAAAGNTNGRNVWYQNWGQATGVNYLNVAGDTTLKYSNLNYQGVEFQSGINASTMDSIHFDIWTPNLTSLRIGLISTGGGEKNLTVSLTKDGWNSVSFALSAFTGVDLSSILQIKFDITPSSGGIIYVQNVYLVNVVGKPTLGSFSIPSQTFGTNTTYNITNPTSTSTGAFTYSSSNTSVATINGNVITIVGGGTSTITASQAADANYSSATVSTVLTVNFASPTTAAATPSIAAAYVTSLYGNTYTNISGISWNPYWGQNPAVVTTFPTIGGKTTIKYASLSYEGVQLASDLDVSTMDTMHLDIWTPNCTSLQIFLIQTTGATVEQSVTVSLTTGGWNKVNIPLISFDNVDLSLLRQMKFVTLTPSTGAVIYLQNVYFMNAVGKPTITGFTIPTQTLGTSTYTITNPTSNSTGAFTYTSSNTSVATISGRVITIKAVGTSTITATQAADNNYLAGSVTSVLTVDYAGPTTAASVPTASSGNITSLWGDTYTNVSGTTWNPYWGQNPAVVTNTTLKVAGKSTLKYSSVTYEGVQLAAGINVSTKNILHFDVWTPNCTSFEMYLINTDNGGLNQFVTVTPTINGWNSINIPLSNYSTVVSNVNQFKIVANTPSSGVVLYFQNIYFSKETPIWTGTTSTDWSVATNWQYGLTPVSTNSVSIPATVTRQPVLAANTTVAGITLNGTLSLNGKVLTLNGAVSGTGSFIGSTTSSLVVAGTVGTINFSSTANKLQDFTITSGSVTLGSNVGVYGLFTPTAGTINTGGKLTLKSTSISSTGIVGVVGGTVSGAVTVERFIPAGLRLYRDLGVGGVSGAGTVFTNWQENGVNNNGYGIQVTGSAGSSAGINATTGCDISLTGNHSLFTYLNNTWDSVLNTKTTNLNFYQGFRVLVRGNRSTDLFTQTTNMLSSATLRATGTLVSGNVNYATAAGTNTYAALTAGAGSYSLVANPYASVVSWNNVFTASSNINASYWYCDPTFTDNGVYNGNTTFIAYNAQSSTTSNPLGKSYVNGYLQPGQAFFVENTTAAPRVSFTEACKAVSQTKTAIFGNTTVNRIATALYRNGNNVDGAVTVFGNNFSRSIGTEDSKKFPNAGENIAFVQSGKDLAINGYSMPTATDILPIHLYQLKANTTYTLRLDVSQFASNVAAFVKDNVTNTLLALNGDSTAVSFTTNATNAASYSNRFSIGFGNTTLSITSLNLRAAAVANGVAINWNTTGENNVAKYAIERSANGTDFKEIGSVKAYNIVSAAYGFTDAEPIADANYYRIKAIDLNGAVNYSNIVVVTIGKTNASIAVFPNPVIGKSFHVSFTNIANGKYVVNVYNKLGQLVFNKLIAHNTANETISLDKQLASGAYTLNIVSENGTTYKSEILIK